MIDFDNLTECPNCGLEFQKKKPNYNFCSYSCFQIFTENNRREKIPTDVLNKWLLKNYLYSNLWQMGYRPSLNWRRWDEEDEMFDEFNRLLERDK